MSSESAKNLVKINLIWQVLDSHATNLEINDIQSQGLRTKSFHFYSVFVCVCVVSAKLTK